MTSPELENAIDRQLLIFQVHPDKAERSKAWTEAQQLIKQRTPEQVMQMEQAKGLM